MWERKAKASFWVYPSWIITSPLAFLLRLIGAIGAEYKGLLPAAFTRTFTALLSAAAYRQLLCASSRPEDRAPIEGKMQMLQWWTKRPTTEALFCWGGGRLALCVCATHRHTAVITLTIQPGWWRRWGVGERLSTSDEDGQSGDANASYTWTIWASVASVFIIFCRVRPYVSLMNRLWQIRLM